MICPKCGGESTEIKDNVPKPHHSKIVCSECNHFLGWGKTPWTFERAASFRMPFGEHEGKTLQEIDQAPRGHDYLEWAAKNCSGGVGTACLVYVAGKH